MIVAIVCGSFLGIVIILAIAWAFLRNPPRLQIQDIKQILEQYMPAQTKELKE